MQESLSSSAVLRRVGWRAGGGSSLCRGVHLLLALGLWLGCSPGSDPSSERAVLAPDFSLERLDGGDRVSLSTLRGKTVVLDFWATWCLPCVEQVPAINSFFAAHASDPDVLVFGVSTDLDGPEIVQKWVTDQGVTYPILLGGDELARDMGAPGFPVTYMLDRHGRIQRRHVGVIEAGELEQNLADLHGDAG
ncbi:MAG: TlpA disulfide reductase family protein [Myxococcota bacterium]